MLKLRRFDKHIFLYTFSSVLKFYRIVAARLGMLYHISEYAKKTLQNFLGQIARKDAKSRKMRSKIAISGLISIFSTYLALSTSHNRAEWSHKCLF